MEKYNNIVRFKDYKIEKAFQKEVEYRESFPVFSANLKQLIFNIYLAISNDDNYEDKEQLEEIKNILEKVKLIFENHHDMNLSFIICSMFLVDAKRIVEKLKYPNNFKFTLEKVIKANTIIKNHYRVKKSKYSGNQN